MPSLNAENVAKDVIRQVKKGKKVVIGKSMEKYGYSKNSIKNPKSVTKQESYQKVMKPFLEQLEEQKQLALDRAKETVGKAQYHQVIDAVDKFTKLTQLLNGDPTENQTINISLDNTLANRYGIVKKDDK